ncbi:MAG TPA: hypothetical protein VGL76_09205 [Gaiellaceae bacterium]
MAVPCWQRLLTDSYDGIVNGVYPVRCYHQALGHIPTVVAIYSSTRDEIERALLRRLGGGGVPVPVVTPPHGGGGGGLPLPFLVLGALALSLALIGVAEQVRRRLRRGPGR